MSASLKTTKPPRCCFVVGQIGGDDSAERIHADWFLEAIVEPVFEKRQDFVVERADKIAHPGLIDAQIITKLLNAELVIADLTGLNPNAFYEIGIRHMSQKPIIHMHLDGERIPFDISLYRSIKYSRRLPKDIRIAQKALSEMIEATLSSDYQVENPITNVLGRLDIERHATPEVQLIMSRLSSIESRLATVELRAHRRPGIGNHLDQIDPNYVSFFSIGDSVNHHKFGDGEVIAVDGAKLTVSFAVGHKRIVDSFVTLASRARRVKG